MKIRCLAVLVAVVIPLLVVGAPPAEATNCSPGSRLFTAAPLYFPGLGPEQVTSFVAFDSISGTQCASGTLRGHCPVPTVVEDGSTITLLANESEGHSCRTGATTFTVVA